MHWSSQVKSSELFCGEKSDEQEACAANPRERHADPIPSDRHSAFRRPSGVRSSHVRRRTQSRAQAGNRPRGSEEDLDPSREKDRIRRHRDPPQQPDFHVQICDQHRESADSQARTRIGQSVVPRGGAGYTAGCRSRTMRVAGSVLRARRLTACTSPRRSANLPWAPAASNLRRAVPSHPRWRCSSRFRSRPA
jgi:hypothetical protein